MDDQTIEDRLRSVERAVTDDDTPPHPRDYDTRLDDIEARLRELEATTQALRGYVGDVRTRDTTADPNTDSDLTTLKHRDNPHPIDDTHPPTTPTTDTDEESFLEKWL